ncbi:hypothetical protein [Sulfurimonas sp.]|uniref:hypothetical protein n=1 Tax=Sulfurimonas sp. TaxID=2022749 RepID=UPI0019E430A3|nr:hypothetical protein [Sulfurimonas sp.]MBE0514590.1 hypothetical protein [Sulfurimonas sp.]
MKNILLWVVAMFAFAFSLSAGKMLVGGIVGAFLGAGLGAVLASAILKKRDLVNKENES